MISCLACSKISCPMVFGLSTLSLSVLGESVQELQQDFLHRDGFDFTRSLFVYDEQVCTARNFVMAFSLFSSGSLEIARNVANALLSSPLFQGDHFLRSFSDEGVDDTVVVHSNLWAVLVLIQQGRIDLAKRVFSFLDARGFASVDCKTGASKLFSDDLALAAVASWFLGDREKALEILSLLRKDFFDERKGLFCRSFGEEIFSTYKNTFCAMVLRMCGFGLEADRVAESLVRELQDPVDGLFVQTDQCSEKLLDNTLLALVACGGKTVFDGLEVLG